MRAAINTTYGAPDVFTVTQAERPLLAPHQILVRVHASDLTEADRRMRSADFPGLSGLFGRLAFGVFGPRQPIGGTSFAGRVVEVGSRVTRFEVGDDVFGGVMHGAYAEYVAVSENDGIAKMPAGAPYAEAATIPYGAVTALVFLRDMAKVQRGERVLIVGASGGVGRMAVQVAKHLGAHVTGVCSRDQDLVGELGADEVIDYLRDDFTRTGLRWDVILDTTEGEHFRAFRPALTPHGRYLSLYLTLGVLFAMAFTALRGGPRALAGVALGSRDHMEEVGALVEAGVLRAVIAARYPLEQIANAHAFFEASRRRGSIVIDVAEPRDASRAAGDPRLPQAV